MDQFPFVYKRIEPTTWAYISSLLMLALFFKFNRFWSVRNFDLFLLIMLAPGLLMVEGGRQWVSNHRADQTEQRLKSLSELSRDQPGSDQSVSDQPTLEKKAPVQAPAIQTPENGVEETTPADSESSIAEQKSGTVNGSAQPPSSDAEDPPTDAAPNDIERAPETEPNTIGHAWQRWGYYWLFGIGAIMLTRLLIDPSLARRPLLEPNLAIGGLVFFGCSLMIFLFANIATSNPTQDDLAGAESALKMVKLEAAKDSDTDSLKRRGPGYTLFNLFPIIPTFENGNELRDTDPEDSLGNFGRYEIAAKSLAIASQIFIVLGLILFCHYVYNDFYIGVGTAAIYLMMPYTAMFTGHVLHCLPAALIVWAIVSFRRPFWSGILVGLATGVSYYPIFLLPLWISFYWERGVGRFIVGVLIAISICVGGLVFTSVDLLDFARQLQAMFGFWEPRMEGLEGIWALGWSNWWRVPLLVAFVLLSISFVAWPTEKNIGTLVSYTAAIMIAVQFWHGFGGGLYMAWYLPMMLLTIFRPNLVGRVALAELRESKRPHKESPEDLLPAA